MQIPVLIVGKGPSARRPTAFETSAFHVAALNGAARLCTRVDTLFVNDVSALKELTKADVARTKTVVLPNKMHVDLGRRLADHQEVLHFFDGCEVKLYELDTNRAPDPSLRRFGRILSVGETAVAWLLADGFREFYTLGIDPAGGYSNHFVGGFHVDKPAAHFVENWNRMRGRVEGQGGTIRRLPDPLHDQARGAEVRKYATIYNANPRYGGDDHGRRARRLVQSLEAQSLLDIGCGRNQFATWARSVGIKAIGVDVASPEADMVAAAHDLSLFADGQFEFVTAFDVLEHLLPGDVEPALAEFGRVASRGLIASICYRDSKIRAADGSTLHPTVRPAAWWVEQLGRVIDVHETDGYLSGFKR